MAKKAAKKPVGKSPFQLTGQQVLDLWGAIRYLKGIKAKARFNYIIAYNERLLEPSVSALQTVIDATTPTLRAYRSAQDALLETHKDPKAEGPPGFVPVKDREAYDVDLEKLRKQYASAVQEAEAHDAEVQELCASVVDLLELARIPLDLVPDDLPGSVFGSLEPIVTGPLSV